MAVKIQLTPQELLSQSQEMLSLQKEFETLFGQSQTILNQVNENWSANLANNFSGKLLSVQKGFSQITSMLEAGGNLAAESAKSYESVDSLLAKVIGGKEGPLSALSGGAAAAAASVSAGAAAMLMPAGSWKEESLGDLQQSWEDSKNFLKWLDEQYEKLDKGTRNRLEKLMGSRWKNGWKITHDIITGEVSWKTGKAFLKAIGDGSLFDKAVAECLQFFLEDTYMDRGVHYNAGMTEQFKRGNILAGITNISGAIMNNFMWGLVT